MKMVVVLEEEVILKEQVTRVHPLTLSPQGLLLVVAKGVDLLLVVVLITKLVMKVLMMEVEEASIKTSLIECHRVCKRERIVT